MARFAQHTKLVAADGCADRLVAKFLEAAAIHQENPDCELLFTGRSPDHPSVVYLTEVWSSEAAWEAARWSPAAQAWARGMPGLVAATPESVQFIPSGGKGLR